MKTAEYIDAPGSPFSVEYDEVAEKITQTGINATTEELRKQLMAAMKEIRAGSFNPGHNIAGTLWEKFINVSYMKWLLSPY